MNLYCNLSISRSARVQFTIIRQYYTKSKVLEPTIPTPVGGTEESSFKTAKKSLGIRSNSKAKQIKETVCGYAVVR